jgi:hypothetical protein
MKTSGIVVSFAVLILAIGNTQAKDEEPNFTALCTDRTDAAFEVSAFVYNFAYSYLEPGWINKYSTSDHNPCHFLPFSQDGFIVKIPFANIKTVEFVDSPSQNQPWNWEPAVKIELRDGNILTGGLGEYGESKREFIGETELGNIALAVNKVKKVEFQHKGEAVKKEPSKTASGDQMSPYSLSIRTWNNKDLSVNNGFLCTLRDGYRCTDVKISFDLKLGETDQTVSFDKIKSLKFKKQGKKEADLMTVSGKTISVTVTGNQLCLGGNLQPFGAGWIDIEKVASVDIGR